MQPSSPQTKPPTRTIRLERPIDDQGVIVFSVTTGKNVTHYAVHEIACDIGGRGFAVHRLGIGQLYHVRVGKPAECSCECLGFLRHGMCKHIRGLQTLIRDAKL